MKQKAIKKQSSEKLSVEEALKLVQKAMRFKRRDGGEALVFCYKENPSFPLCGWIIQEVKNKFHVWTNKGKSSEFHEHDWDLVEYLGPEFKEK